MAHLGQASRYLVHAGLCVLLVPRTSLLCTNRVANLPAELKGKTCEFQSNSRNRQHEWQEKTPEGEILPKATQTESQSPGARFNTRERHACTHKQNFIDIILQKQRYMTGQASKQNKEQTQRTRHNHELSLSVTVMTVC